MRAGYGVGMSSRGGLFGRVLAAAAAAVVVVGLGASPAAAHDELLGTEPADGATVDAAPPSVVLTFSAPALELGTEVLVTGPDGAPVGEGAAVVDGATVTQALAATRPAGAYRVDWRVTSQDGHPVTGTFTFTATTGVAPTPTPTPAGPAASPADDPVASATIPPPTAVIVAPSPTPTEAVVAPGERGGLSTVEVLTVLAVVAALLVAVRLGRAASLRRRAASPGQPTGEA